MFEKEKFFNKKNTLTNGINCNICKENLSKYKCPKCIIP